MSFCVRPASYSSNQLSSFSRAKAPLSYPFASFSDQPKHTALGDAVLPSNVGGGCAGGVLND
jgi:hypothetical protein